MSSLLRSAASLESGTRLNSGPSVCAAFLLPPETFQLLYGEEALVAVRERARVPNPTPTSPAALPDAPAGWLEELEVVFTGWGGPRFDDALLQRLPRLRAVFHGGGSVRPHVSAAFWARGLTITSAASANAIPVAEFAVAAIVLSLKRAWQLNRQIVATRSYPAAHPAVPGTRGSTVGLVSLGLIGRLVLERLRSVEVKVIAHDPHLSATVAGALGVELVPLPELMARSDVVSLHTPLNATTEGLIGGDLLACLKPGATLINTARGAIVRELELIAFLQRRPDVQAILDVTAPDPPVAGSPLFELPNVFLTPHIAGSLGPECRRLGAMAVAEFRRYLQGEPLLHPVTCEQAELQT